MLKSDGRETDAFIKHLKWLCYANAIVYFIATIFISITPFNVNPLEGAWLIMWSMGIGMWLIAKCNLLFMVYAFRKWLL
jgi:hypothetical protein